MVDAKPGITVSVDKPELIHPHRILQIFPVVMTILHNPREIFGSHKLGPALLSFQFPDGQT